MEIWLAVSATCLCLVSLAICGLLLWLARSLSRLTGTLETETRTLHQTVNASIQRLTDAAEKLSANRRLELDREMDTWRTVAGQLERSSTAASDATRALALSQAEFNSLLKPLLERLSFLADYHKATLRVATTVIPVVEEFKTVAATLAAALGIKRQPAPLSAVTPSDADAAAVQANMAGLTEVLGAGVSEPDEWGV